MNKSKKIVILIITAILLGIGIYFGIDFYNKTSDLTCERESSHEAYIEKQVYIFKFNYKSLVKSYSKKTDLIYYDEKKAKEDYKFYEENNIETKLNKNVISFPILERNDSQIDYQNIKKKELKKSFEDIIMYKCY